MIKILFSAFLILLTIQCSEKKVTNEKVTTLNSSVTESSIIKPFAILPKSLDESSGLKVINGKIYSMNDSGGEPELFVFDSHGEELNKIEIKNAKNYDWESLAVNSTHFFIGDFGNNSGNRENLSVYMFPIKDLNKKNVKAKKIKFRYKNQENFFNINREHSFDGEALIALEDELVIFSKDWNKLATQVYHLSLGNTKSKIAISPSEKMEIDALITGADYDAENKRLVLCGYKDNMNFLWLFEDSTPENFLTNNFKKLTLYELFDAQIEGVTFLDQSTILFSTEKTKTFKQQLWTVDLKDF